MPPPRLSRRFFARPTIVVAQALLGHTLFHETSQGLVGGRIVEVEAYRGPQDPGSHAYRGMTRRNSVMFGPPGHLYVYFTYGMHHCCNVVTEKDGVAGAVLLRAVEPTHGLDIMETRRITDDPHLLAKGPGRLCQAFGFAREHDGLDLVDGPAWISRTKRLKAPIKASARIGLRAGIDEPWRYYEPGPWTSGKKG